MDVNRNFPYFLYQHSFHSNAKKTFSFFLSFTNNQEPSHVNAHVAKLVPLFLTQLRSQDPIDPLKVTDHFTCISTNVIYCITCTLCKKIYIGETGRRLAGCLREHLRDIEKKNNNTDASKTFARHFNLPNHSHNNMIICGLSLHYGNTESRKNLEQKFIFQLGTLSSHGINERLSFH